METVIFRKWKAGKNAGKVIALFPEQDGEIEDTCLAYELVEGELLERSLNYNSVRSRTTKPHSSAVRPLKKALTEMGLDLKVRDRAPGSGREKIDANREEKLCPVCERVLPREAFTASASKRDGMHSTCKECSTIEVSCINLSHKTEEEMIESIRTAKTRIERIRLLQKGYTPRQIAKMEQGAA